MAAHVTAISSGTMYCDVITLHAGSQNCRSSSNDKGLKDTERSLCVCVCVCVSICTYIYLSIAAYGPVSFEREVTLSAQFSFLT
jgi:hypothetical protein